MDIKLPFTLLFFTIHVAFTPLFASSEPRLAENNCTYPVFCDALPPDSLRVTSKGPNFVALAWKPAFPGASHHLSVFKKNATGGWDSLYSEPNVMAANYTVYNVQPGKIYRVRIKTKCGNEEPSTLSNFIDFHGLIIELAVQARIPVKPEPVADCTNVDYLMPDHEWVGYRVSYETELGEVSNLFEFERLYPINDGDPEVRIRRGTIGNPIVAANQNEEWPTPAFPAIKSVPSVRMGIVDNSVLDVFGHVYLALIGSSSVHICQDVSPIWDNNYKFEVLTAKEVLVFSPGGPNHGRTSNNSIINSIKVQSPFHEILNIFILGDSPETGVSKICLAHPNGQIVLEQNFESTLGQVSIPVGSVLPGLYFLRIESRGEVQILKAIKAQ